VLRVIDSAIAELEARGGHHTNQSGWRSRPAPPTAEGRHRVVARVQTARAPAAR
jgi:hypothetical protein